ncbi:ubiquinone biosynthesis monooxygenase Coq7 [Rhizobium sp. BK456]|nr:ubiquinone biosynthesis monooxygenase Coq7 [Rhizobium sp. BK456]
MINPSSNAGMRDPDVTVRRILKVNHAGEFGAIRIYGAQILMARRLFPGIVPALEEMREDEIEHCRLFREAMPARRARPCRVMAFWSLGGSVLGILTALGGRNMIWICTQAVESTVHRHLEDQLAFSSPSVIPNFTPSSRRSRNRSWRISGKPKTARRDGACATPCSCPSSVP